MHICQFTSEDSQPIRLLQITDCHLFADKQQNLLGVNTYDSFHAVLAEIQKQQRQFDHLLVTGDISQDQSSASYQHFVDAVKDWKKTRFWLPGNHDHVANMHQVMTTLHSTRCEQVLLGKTWQMIILDSQVAGKPHGYLNEAQFTLMETALKSHPERFSLILLHHHPRLSGSAWLDQHRLQNADEFWQALAHFPQVKGVVCGHIHQDFDEVFQQCRVMAAPSTCIQFLPHSADFALDTTAPGWREITLHANGEITTEIGRLSQSAFFPDMGSSGY